MTVRHTDDNISFRSCFLNYVNAIKIAIDKLDARKPFCNGFGTLFVADVKCIVVIWVCLIYDVEGSAANIT